MGEARATHPRAHPSRRRARRRAPRRGHHLHRHGPACASAAQESRAGCEPSMKEAPFDGRKRTVSWLPATPRCSPPPGMNRVGPRIHFFATLMVALGTTISASWILAANQRVHAGPEQQIKAPPGRMGRANLVPSPCCSLPPRAPCFMS
ncbi:hypothetical protein EYW47_14400 [Paraburkholderia silviterrae]|uniref:Uncharacterized protein n=1 Tax=Paraburkholderia silviterrae TaxID=2528715 RepID=A0A4R5M940_9BURK|nr:hypothetical protein EYW47_14400 [Paraburkholderia silviterrae]